MTSQTPDFFQYKDKKYCVLGWTEGALASAQDFGLKFLSGSTADARGYSIWYAINQDNMFIVDKIEIRGKEVSKEHKYEMIEHKNKRFYDKFNHIVPFTGYILISSIASFPSLYSTTEYDLFEIEIKQGHVVEIREIGSEIRSQLKDRNSHEIFSFMDSDNQNSIVNLEKMWDFTSTILGRQYNAVYIIFWYFHFKEILEIERNKSLQ